MEYLDFLKRKQIVDFPSGIDKEAEINLILFPFQRDIARWALRRGRAAVFAGCGLGKGQPYGSKILTPTGWINIEDLKIGDDIIGGNGEIQKVTGVFFKGEIDTYKFHYSDNSSCIFDKEHLHICRTQHDRARGKGWRVLSTMEILEMPLKYGKGQQSRNFDIPVILPVSFEKKELNIAPYLLGVLLGDGHLSGNYSISSKDDALLSKIESLLPKGIMLEKIKGENCDYKIKTGITGNRHHYFRQYFIDYGLHNTRSNNKFIPQDYLYSEVNDRLELLKGLMDTDGYIMPCGTCQYYSISKQLIDDVLFLVRSLGGVPTLSKKKTFYKKEGVRVDCQDCYTLTFSLKTFNPFFLKRKAERYNANPRDNGRWIDQIKFEKKEKTVCISVDSLDGSYVTEHFIVTHNTFIQLEWAKHVPEKILILAPLAVSQQTIREGKKLGIEVKYCREQKQVDSKITIANYEMLHKFDASQFNGIVLDESSLLKNFAGSTRNLIIESFANTPFRLACTATPAPNDYMELGNHAEFLGIQSRSEMLSMFFVHDGGETSKWRLKGHAENEYWKWLASWAVMMQKPSDLGYEDDGFILPKLNYYEHIVNNDSDTEFNLFRREAKTLLERRQARRDSLDDRVKLCADIINESDETWLIWCNLNSEGNLLEKMIKDSLQIEGSDNYEFKEKNMLAFSDNKIRCLITKPSIAGHGMNWQNCHNIAFVGLSDSWEEYYQAIRRCWRFGQKEQVNVHVIISEKEGAVLKNIKRKEENATNMLQNMVKHMHKINEKNLCKLSRDIELYSPQIKMNLPSFLKG